MVGAIRDAVTRVDAEYIHSFVDLGRRHAGLGKAAERAGEELASTAAGLGTTFCMDLRWTAGWGSGSTTLTFFLKEARSSGRSFKREGEAPVRPRAQHERAA